MSSSDTSHFIQALIHSFFTIESNVKVYHWQTKSYSRHKSTDNFLLKVLPLMDQMIEVLLGIFPSVKSSLSKGLSTMPVKVRVITEHSSKNALSNELSNELSNGIYEEETIVKMSNELVSQLNTFESRGITQTSVLNIRDSIVGEIKQMLYLFSFE